MAIYSIINPCQVTQASLACHITAQPYLPLGNVPGQPQDHNPLHCNVAVERCAGQRQRQCSTTRMLRWAAAEVAASKAQCAVQRGSTLERKAAAIIHIDVALSCATFVQSDNLCAFETVTNEDSRIIPTEFEDGGLSSPLPC